MLYVTMFLHTEIATSKGEVTLSQRVGGNHQGIVVDYRAEGAMFSTHSQSFGPHTEKQVEPELLNVLNKGFNGLGDMVQNLYDSGLYRSDDVFDWSRVNINVGFPDDLMKKSSKISQALVVYPYSSGHNEEDKGNVEVLCTGGIWSLNKSSGFSSEYSDLVTSDLWNLISVLNSRNTIISSVTVNRFVNVS